MSVYEARHSEVMRYLTHSILAALLLFGVCAAEPTISVQDVPTDEYAQWLTEKEALWSTELKNLKPFAPEQVQSMEATREHIRSNARALEANVSESEADALKAETNQLVYGLENSLEEVYGDLQQKSGPALVLNL